MPYITTQHSKASKAEIYFEDYGSWDPIVLIHWWPLSHRMWEAQREFLVDRWYRVIAYDRRGFWDSSKSWDGHNYDVLAADLKDILDSLEVRKAHLVWFSMGWGEVARYIGNYWGNKVASATLVSAVTPYMLKTADNPDGVDMSTFENMKQWLENDRPHFLSWFGKNFVNADELDISDELLNYFHHIALFASPHATYHQVTAFAETDFRNDIESFSIPTLVVHWDADQIVPIEVSGERVAEMVPHSTYHIIKNAPHGLTTTHKDEFNKTLIDFLENNKI